jgi:hypothetical protein
LFFLRWDEGQYQQQTRDGYHTREGIAHGPMFPSHLHNRVPLLLHERSILAQSSDTGPTSLSETYAAHGAHPWLTHVPCHLWTRPGALPQWRAASGRERHEACSEGGLGMGRALRRLRKSSTGVARPSRQPARETARLQIIVSGRASEAATATASTAPRPDWRCLGILPNRRVKIR